MVWFHWVQYLAGFICLCLSVYFFNRGFNKHSDGVRAIFYILVALALFEAAK